MLELNQIVEDVLFMLIEHISATGINIFRQRNMEYIKALMLLILESFQEEGEYLTEYECRTFKLYFIHYATLLQVSEEEV